MIRYFLIVLLAMLTFPSSSQNIPTSTWRNHFSFQNARLLTTAENQIFCASQNGLFSFNPQDGSINTLSKISGLSSTGATATGFSQEERLLLIGYENGLIDLVSDEGVVTTLRELEIGNFGQNKTITKFETQGDFGYAATDFGVAVIDLDDRQLQEVFREIGPGGDVLEVRDLLIDGNVLYAISEIGILAGSLSDNLLDFNNWSVFTETSSDFSNLLLFNGIPTSSFGNALYQLNSDTNTWQPLPITIPFDITDLASSDQQLFILGENRLLRLENGQLMEMFIDRLSRGNQLALDGNELYIADGINGLIRLNDGFENAIVPNGPASSDIRHIKYSNGLYAFYVASPDANLPVDSTGYSLFENGLWSNDTLSGFYNISDVGIFNNEIYLSSNGFGLLNLSTNELLNDSNPDSPFEGSDIILPSISQGDDRFWVSRFNSSDVIFELNNEGWFVSRSTEVGTSFPVQLITSFRNVQWITRSTIDGAGLIAFSTETNDQTFLDRTDGLPSEFINSVIIDQEDQAWVGTRSGIVFFPDASFVFDGFGAIEPIFDNAILLEGEEITTIAIDGGNRKWIGTNNGLWVFSDDISTQDERFTEENSFLPSDEIIELAYDGDTGEMFILTSRGLISYS